MRANLLLFLLFVTIPRVISQGTARIGWYSQRKKHPRPENSNSFNTSFFVECMF